MFKEWQIREGNRLYLRGAGTLSPSELLAFILRDKAAGEKLLTHFGSLTAIREATSNELMAVKGISKGRAEIILCVFELLRRTDQIDRKNGSIKVRSPKDVSDFLEGEMRCLDKEVFKEILLNTKNSVIQVLTVAIGSLNAALVHPREILKPAIRQSAAGLILCHNHPSGDPAPSTEDADLTSRIYKSCELVGIDLIDHIILGSEGRYFSFRENNLNF